MAAGGVLPLLVALNCPIRLEKSPDARLEATTVDLDIAAGRECGVNAVVVVAAAVVLLVREVGPSADSVDNCLSVRDGSELSFPCLLACCALFRSSIIHAGASSFPFPDAVVVPVAVVGDVMLLLLWLPFPFAWQDSGCPFSPTT